MEYIYLLAAVCCSAMLSIMSSLFGKQNAAKQNASLLYSVIVTGAAFLSWGVICLSEDGLDLRVTGYSAVFGAFYTVAMIGMFKAYQIGSVSLTAFVKQLSLIGVAFWGFIFWDNPLTPNIAIGFVWIIAALYLCFKPNKNSAEKPASLKWCFFASMLLVGNAGCSIIQKYQQMAFHGGCRSVFMFFGAGVSFAFSLLLYLKSDRCRVWKIATKTLVYPVIGGVSSALLNLLILLMLASPLSESIIFPGIAVGGLVLTMLFSVIGYHERLRPVQWCGLAIGSIAFVFLNI